MRLRLAARVGLGVCVAVGGLAAAASCGDTSGLKPLPVTVFAASSLTGAFAEIATAFEAATPGALVTLSFGASSELATQINNGAPADVFASADIKSVQKLPLGAVFSSANFASNRLQIIVQRGNPRAVTSLADLANPGLTYVTAAPEVPIGKYTQQVLDKAGIKVIPKSFEANAKGIVNKVTLGEADAGIVYVTDVLAAGDKATGVDIPVAQNVVAHYPIALLKLGGFSDPAKWFVDFVLSPQGQQILAKYGFGSP